MFAFQLSDILIYTFGATVAVAIVLLLLILPPLVKVRRRVATDSAVQADDISTAAYPEVSIIVHACGEATNLATLIPMLFEQVYEPHYEVIVVNDGSDDNVTDTINRLQLEYRHLYMTFTPPRSRNLSRRKLAITLGMKAANHPVVAILGGNCRLISPYWLMRMMGPIAHGKGVVSGYGFVVPTGEGAEDKRRHRLMAFDIVRTSVEYLSSAISGKMYRAFGDNVAYRRRLFVESRGFADSLSLRYGDDDVFISAIARVEGGAVQLARDAMVEVLDDNPQRLHRLDKLRHNFTARYCGGTPSRLRWGFVSALWWLWTAGSVATILLALPTIWGAVAATVLALLLTVPVMVTWRRCSVALENRRLMLTVPFFLWISPFYGLVYKIIGRRNRSKNFTWSAR